MTSPSIDISLVGFKKLFSTVRKKMLLSYFLVYRNPLLVTQSHSKPILSGPAKELGVANGLFN